MFGFWLFLVLCVQPHSVILEALRKLKLMSLDVDVLKVGFLWIVVVDHEVLYWNVIWFWGCSRRVLRLGRLLMVWGNMVLIIFANLQRLWSRKSFWFIKNFLELWHWVFSCFDAESGRSLLINGWTPPRRSLVTFTVLMRIHFLQFWFLENGSISLVFKNQVVLKVHQSLLIHL